MKCAIVILLFLSLTTGTFASRSQTPPIPCNQVISHLTVCISYLMRSAASPSRQCCDGVQYLASNSRHKADRVSVCQCLERSVAMFPQLDISLVPQIPSSCGLGLKLPPIDSVSFDCSKA